MEVIVVQAIGLFLFLAGSFWLAGKVRDPYDDPIAAQAARISHGLFWGALVLPGTIGLFHPGLGAYDEVLGVPGLPVPSVWIALGAVLLGVSLVLTVCSNRSLITKGMGGPAFLLTKHLVTVGVYGRTRNPMSLGFYAGCTGIGMIAGSLSVTLGVLLVLIPVHLFNLKYVEERDLERRFGDAYTDYRRRVPFLFPRLSSSDLTIDE